MTSHSARACVFVVLAAMTLVLGGWRLSSDDAIAPGPWNPKGKAVVKSPDGVSHVVHSSFCSLGRHGGVRLRFGGKLAARTVTTDRPYIHLVAQRREGNPSVLDIFDGVINLPPKWGWADAMHVEQPTFKSPADVARSLSSETGPTWRPTRRATPALGTAADVSVRVLRLPEPNAVSPNDGRRRGYSLIRKRTSFTTTNTLILPLPDVVKRTSKVFPGATAFLQTAL